MASYPKQTVYTGIGEAGADASFTDIPCTINCRRMEIVEVPPPNAGNQGNFLPQGLQYQLYDSSLKQWGPTVQALPGEQVVVGDQVAEWRGRGPIVGWRQQSDHFGNVRPADTPIRIMSGTATATQILVNEYA